MKIVQFFDDNGICLAVVKNNTLLPVDFDGDMLDFIEQKKEPAFDKTRILTDQIKFAPPVLRPSKIIAIGLNYKDHAKESKGAIPETPLLFSKFPSSLVGHNAMISWSNSITKKVDFEAELAVIIGKKIFNCPSEKALGAVFGYSCSNDVSARDLQFGDKQWVRGKSLDTFCPLGPWIVTADEIEDPNNLEIKCWLNGTLMQKSNTSQMIFSVAELISFLSQHFTLLPGDVILTGTPSGVGVFRTPSVYLKNNDKVVVEIEKIGKLVNTCHVKNLQSFENSTL